MAAMLGSDSHAVEAAVLEAYRHALARALPPREQLARHWTTPHALSWLGLNVEGDGFTVAFAFGALKGPSLTLPGHVEHTGFFRLAPEVFPGVDTKVLNAGVQRLVPAQADGATRTFLGRVVSQLALGACALAFQAQPELLPMATAADFGVALPQRKDAAHLPARTPRMPAHAEARVTDALARMEPRLRERITALFAAPSETLLEALRVLG
jgi:hypothetical protein